MAHHAASMHPTRPLMPLLAATALGAVEPAVPQIRLIDLSLDVMTAAGASTADDELIDVLQAGGHDPRRRGFTLQQAELSMVGAVDPYFRAEGHLAILEDAIELEEAFAQTTSLPAGLELEAGLSLAEFGRNNPTHPHSWAWTDRPLPVARLLGGDGTRGVGTRIGWETPLPWYSRIHAGLMDATNEVATSFGGAGEEEGEPTIGGRQFTPVEVHSLGDLLWSLRWENAIDLSDATLVKAGASLLAGPNATGPDGETFIYGVDAAIRWLPEGSRQGFPSATIEAEWILRDYTAAAQDDVDIDGDGTPDYSTDEESLTDWGIYVQCVFGIARGWAAGLRYEHVTGSGDSVDDTGADLDSDADPGRDSRTRVSPLLIWNPTHFSKLRLQYNYDQFTHQDELPDGEDQAHTVWLSLEVLIGAHPSHAF